MSFETALRSRMKGDPAFAGASVEWDERPQGKITQSIVIETIAGEREQTFKGPQKTNRDRLQFNVFAMDKATAVALREAIIAIVFAPATVDGIEFQRGSLVMHRSDTDSTENGTVRIEIVDAYLWHSTV